MTLTASRIKARWNRQLGGVQNNVLQGGGLTGGTPGISIYSGSTVTDSSSDFLGDWRAADSWQRFDMWRVRNRCRQLFNGNPLVQAYCRNMGNNVLGHKGMHFKSIIATSKAFGDTTEGMLDDRANQQIEANYIAQGALENLTTKKILSRRDLDRLLMNKLIVDGEFLMRKIRGFDNEWNFAWQVVDADYLDQNLNRVESGMDELGNRVAAPGNLTKMGVELDKDFKFPVAYWLLHRRPNDYTYNYASLQQQRYIRVPADEVLHVYLQNSDPEQTRGWPWFFAAVVNLFRAEKFQEAALINATIGASKTTYFTKDFPTGYDVTPDMLESNGAMVRELQPGTGEELPIGVKPVAVDMRYPDAEFGPFMQAMNLATASTFGTSYATTTGDLSQANFVSSRMGQIEEREFYMSVQEFFIERWKKPAFDEELYRSMLAGKVSLPISKFEKFHRPQFTGRRWQFVQPVDDMRALELKLNNRMTSVSAAIREQGGDPEKVFAEIEAEEKLFKEKGIERRLNIPPNVPAEAGDGGKSVPPNSEDKTD